MMERGTKMLKLKKKKEKNSIVAFSSNSLASCSCDCIDEPRQQGIRAMERVSPAAGE